MTELNSKTVSKPPTTTAGPRPATQAVFERILRDIVGGKHAAHSRLPSERDLASDLAASRPTVREAVRRLTEWGLVDARRGSGIVVQPITDWSLDVLPAYLIYGKPNNDGPELAQVIADTLAVRQLLLCSFTQMIAPRLSADDIANGRSALEAAWAARGTDNFPRLDFEIFRTLANAAQVLPALWLLNVLGKVYSEIATQFAAVIGPPDDYLESYHRIFSALSRGDGDGASRELSDFYDRQDKGLRVVLEAITK